MIGASIEQAPRFVYADALSQGGAVPVGVSCRLCVRQDCAHRAFDPLPGIAPQPDALPVP